MYNLTFIQPDKPQLFYLISTKMDKDENVHR